MKQLSYKEAKVLMQIRIPLDMRNDLAQKARDHDTSMNAEVTEALRQYLAVIA